MIKFLKYLLQALFVYFFFITGKLLGLSWSRKLYSFIFKKIGPLFKSKKIIEGNLEKFLKNDNVKKEKIILDMWSNYGMTFIEYIFLKKFRKNNSHISIDGREKLIKIAKSKKSVIFISGHFANFELMSMELTKAGVNLATIYRPLNNYLINPFMEYLRKKYICKNQIQKGIKGVKDAIKFIENKHSIALMVDQRVSEGERIDFFNHKALTTTLPAQLALKYNMEIIPILIKRDDDLNFKMKIYDPVNLSNTKNKLEITKKLNQVLEKLINENPNQWIWTHNRWK
tara:strand:+ start:142 stop:996 length:855 start_codon:yes stop_codon:yes gene_type:complete